jgi:hypothetical protein
MHEIYYMHIIYTRYDNSVNYVISINIYYTNKYFKTENNIINYQQIQNCIKQTCKQNINLYRSIIKASRIINLVREFGI